jgi:hypothetical protein
MAMLFGQGATYDAIEGRFRRYRKMADELKDEARGNGITELPRSACRNPGSSTSTPRTPQGPRGGITKRTPASSGRGKKDSGQAQTPTKKRGKPGKSIMDAICVDDGGAEEESKVKLESAGFISRGEGDDVQMIDLSDAHPSSSSAAATAAMAALTAKVKKEKIERNLAKKEEEENTSPNAAAVRATRCKVHNQEGAELKPAGIEEDPFYMAGSYFSQAQVDYAMDDIYGESA